MLSLLFLYLPVSRNSYFADKIFMDSWEISPLLTYLNGDILVIQICILLVILSKDCNDKNGFNIFLNLVQQATTYWKCFLSFFFLFPFFVNSLFFSFSFSKSKLPIILHVLNISHILFVLWVGCLILVYFLWILCC